MLTESVSDPRRANWLTISSMSEDLCWPEETNSRPSWELEAEILRLTTRLMMRERELRQVKNQLKTQTSRAQQQAATWRRRMEEKEEQMRILLVQKDAEMQNIVSQLLLFEAELRQEQNRIEELLSEKDAQIVQQQNEIERLKRSSAAKSSVRADSVLFRCDSSNDSMPKREKNTISNKCSVPVPESVEESTVVDSQDAVQKLKDGLVKIRAIQDVTNMKLDTSNDIPFNEKKRVPTKAPQKMKDLKAKRFNHHKVHRSVMSEICGQAIL